MYTRWCDCKFFFVVAICVTREYIANKVGEQRSLKACTVPPLADIIDTPASQALPYIFHTVMGRPGIGLGLIFSIFLDFLVTFFCSISITVAASCCTRPFTSDDALPGAKMWAKINKRLGVPVNSLALVTAVWMLLGIIDIGSSSAFTAFIPVGVQAMALDYEIPIAISLLTLHRKVNQARWTVEKCLGLIANAISLAWNCV